MKIIAEKNIIISNPETKSFLVDAFYKETSEKLPLVIFVHGYKGYKDWGAWNLMAESFAQAGFFFVKFNFSHNGTTIERPSDFGDLEAFGQNNYSKELSDLDVVINYFIQKEKVEAQNVTLIGHSRGGGISIIKASEDSRIRHLITLASVESLDRFPKGEAFEDWKSKGVYYSFNGRTGQQMPHYFQFFEDFESNKERFSIEIATKKFDGGFLIIHGTQDEAVDVSAATQLHGWKPNSTFQIIDSAQHTFGAKEPWLEEKLPSDLQKATDIMIDFLKLKQQ